MHFSRLPSGSIRLHATINGSTITITTKLKVKEGNWTDQTATGSGCIIINNELERIKSEVNDWVMVNPIHTYTIDLIKTRVKSIILNTKQVEKRKTIDSYFNEFVNEKQTEVNPITNTLISDGTVQTYHTAFDKLKKFKALELEEINKRNYHLFVSHLLENYKVNTAGKTVRRLKTFFTWCQGKGLPISSEYIHWKAFSEDTDEETRALNSEQLDRIYTLNVDPVEVFQLAKKLHNKNLDGKHVNDLCQSIKNAANHAVAMASIGSHWKDFYNLAPRNVQNDVIKYRRGKNKIQFVAPFHDNHIWHAKEFADMDGPKLFKRIGNTKLNYYLSYIQELCEIPFKITASNFRKTFGSIIYFESDHPNKLALIMKAYGHRKETTTRKYLGIQDDDLVQDYKELFS